MTPLVIPRDEIAAYEKETGFAGIGDRMIRAGLWVEKDPRERVRHLEELAAEQEKKGRPVDASAARVSARVCRALWGIEE